MAKKILIFGATGSVGSSLTKLVKESLAPNKPTPFSDSDQAPSHTAGSRWHRPGYPRDDGP